MIRTKLTPFFSSGKLRQMFTLMATIGTELDQTISEQILKDSDKSICTEIKDIVARYTTDVIASCAFGVNAHSLTNPLSCFRESGRKIIEFTYQRAIDFTCIFFLPDLGFFIKPNVKNNLNS